MKLHSYFSLHLQRYKINLQIYLHILNVYLHNVIFMGNSIFQGNIFIFLLIANHVFVQQFSSLHTLGIGRRQFLERSRTVSVNLMFRRKEIPVTSGNRFKTITLTTFGGRGCIIHVTGLQGIYAGIVSIAVATRTIVDLQSRLLALFRRVPRI